MLPASERVRAPRRGCVASTVSLTVLIAVAVACVDVCAGEPMQRSPSRLRDDVDGVWHVRAVYDVVLQRNVTHAGAQLTSSQYVLCDVSSSVDDGDGGDGGNVSGGAAPPSSTAAVAAAMMTQQHQQRQQQRQSRRVTVAAEMAFDPYAEAERWCVSGVGVHTRQAIVWSSVLPPGLYARAWRNTTLRDVLLQCITLGCDMDNLRHVTEHHTLIDSFMHKSNNNNNNNNVDDDDDDNGSPATTATATRTTTAVAEEPALALGGVGAATPCAGSTNHTFMLFVTPTRHPPVIVQSNWLPFDTLNTYAQGRLDAVYCGSGSTATAAVAEGGGVATSTMAQRLRSVVHRRDDDEDNADTRLAVKGVGTATTAISATTTTTATTNNNNNKYNKKNNNDGDDDNNAADGDGDDGKERSVCVAPASFCLIRLTDPRFTGAAAAADATQLLLHGDGALTMPVWVGMCGQELSTVLAPTMDLLRNGYTAMLTLREHVDALALPRELIHAIASWTRFIAVDDATTTPSTVDTHGGKGVGGGGGDDDDDDEEDDRMTRRGATLARSTAPPHDAGASVSLRDSGACAWQYNASLASRYYTGEVYTCRLHASMRNRLPPLTLHVLPEFVAHATTTTTTGAGQRAAGCTFTLDLNALVRRGGRRTGGTAVDNDAHDDDDDDVEDDVLELPSSGSVEAWLHGKAFAAQAEPFIVVGSAFLRGATVATTRDARVAAMARGTSGVDGGGGSRAWRGLPLLYLATYNAADVVVVNGSSSSSSSSSNSNNNNNNGGGGRRNHRRHHGSNGGVGNGGGGGTATAVRGNATAAAAGVENGTYAGCVAPVRCMGDRTYFGAVNRCADTQCRGLLALRYSATTLECSLDRPMLVLFATLLSLALIVEVVLLCVRAWSERVKEAYMQDMHRMLRK